MGLFYSFVSLEAEQLTRRRQLLDRYGQIAQLSAVILLLLIYISFLSRSVLSRYIFPLFGRSRKEHQSPRVSTFRQAATGPWKTRWRRVTWALDDELWDGWGTKKEWAVAGVWALWLLVCVVRDTGDDYLHLSKRFGIVAASQLPLHYLLALKSWSPIQYLTRLSHEELNPYHRLLGRILIFFFACHAGLYMNFYIQSGLLHRFGSQTVILGLVAISIFALLGTSSLAKVRDYSYLLFFTLHVGLSITILPVLWFHVSHVRVYIAESALIYIALIAQRNLSQTPTLATLTLLPSSPLLSISFPLPRSKLRAYAPGTHIYLALPAPLLRQPWQKLRLNPFTIAAISDPLPTTTASTQPTPPSAKTPQATLLIRPLRSTTAHLKSLALSPNRATIPILIEGPYGAATHFRSQEWSAVLLVAGGVGASFTLPIYRDLQEKGRGGNVKMVWCVRRRSEVESIDAGGVSVYVTGHERAEEDGGIELEGLLTAAVDDDDDDFHHGRPDFKTLVREFFEAEGGEGKVAVLVCGPRGMGRSLRREVGMWVAKGREVWWHGEEFGW